MENILLKLLSISSSKTDDLECWKPDSIEDTIICLDLEIGSDDPEKGSNMFYVIVATPQALKWHKINPKKSKILVINNYSFANILEMIEQIISKCSISSWDKNCQELSKYFHWEYESSINA